MQPIQDRGKAFSHQRLAPPLELAPFIQHFWFVQWDFRGQIPSTAETLPHPSCYLVFEHDLEQPVDEPGVPLHAELSGVTTCKFSRPLAGYGRVFGLKFQPGGLRPFLRHPAWVLTNRVVPAAEIFGPPILDLTSKLRALQDAESMAAITVADFMENRPAHDPAVEMTTALVNLILTDSTLLSVEAVAKQSGLSVRSLQRLFREYVGVSPKWVIRRFRVHELLERLNVGQPFDGARVALELGYADQAHLINDFRKLTGYTPIEYAKTRDLHP